MCLKNVSKTTVSLLFVFSCCRASEHVPRILSMLFDLSRVQRIYLYPGRASIIDFPCQITRAAVGPSGDVVVTLTATKPNELDVWLKSDASESTNMLVRCDSKVFSFDVIASRSNHQEYIKIVDTFGFPTFNIQSRVLLSSGDRTAITTDATPKYKIKNVISSSQGDQ